MTKRQDDRLSQLADLSANWPLIRAVREYRFHVEKERYEVLSARWELAHQRAERAFRAAEEQRMRWGFADRDRRCVPHEEES